MCTPPRVYVSCIQRLQRRRYLLVVSAFRSLIDSPGHYGNDGYEFSDDDHFTVGPSFARLDDSSAGDQDAPNSQDLSGSPSGDEDPYSSLDELDGPDGGGCPVPSSAGQGHPHSGRSRQKRRTKRRVRRKMVVSAAVTHPESPSPGEPAVRSCAAQAGHPETPTTEPDDQLYEVDANAISPANDEPGTITVQQGDVRRSSGAEWEQWRAAAEAELNNSFFGMDAIAVATPADIAAAGTILPMKAVWTIKPGGLHKCRGVVCGNFQERDPCEQVWTAQADTASVMSGVRLAQLRKWDIGKLDIKGAFMHTPMPPGITVVVRPPPIWEVMGLVQPGAFWVLRKAVYGLRISPRAWGNERDSKFRSVKWSTGGKTYRLTQCHNDSQVWRITESNGELPGTDPGARSHTLGLLICYVDDLLLLIQNGAVKNGLIEQLRALWTMSTEVDLQAGTPFSFLGLEFERSGDGVLHIHQRTLIRKVLVEHGLGTMSKGISAITMTQPTEEDTPPDDKQLKVLQAFAGEFNWLATRTRPDLAYTTSVIASAAKHHGAWTLQLCKKVLRYLLHTREEGLTIPWGSFVRPVPCSAGQGHLHPEGELIVWSDAGYGGLGTKAQTGVLISWCGAVVMARSSRQTNSALSTCESEVAAAAQAFVCVEGLSCLLREWGVSLDPPVLLVDNKSALTICELGGSWRTRYFAVRAARLAEEYTLGHLSLRYCPTSDMVADGLTKLASASVMEMLRQAMAGTFPPIPEASQSFKLQDPTWWASSLRLHNLQRAAKPVTTRSTETQTNQSTETDSADPIALLDLLRSHFGRP